MEIKTGDIILFSGRGIISRLIQVATKSKFSHIGVVYVESNHEPLVFHSTSLTTPKGTKLETLSDLLKNYNGKLYHRKLTPSVDCCYAKKEIFRQYIKDTIGTKYESSYIELILSAFGRKLNLQVKTPTSALYCSELVANLYRKLGFITHSNALTPADFSDKGEDYLGLPDSIKLYGQRCLNDKAS
jgi:hypothetical protein